MPKKILPKKYYGEEAEVLTGAELRQVRAHIDAVKTMPRTEFEALFVAPPTRRIVAMVLE